MNCEKCIFYTKGFWSAPRCTRISNYNIAKKKMEKFNMVVSQRICKGYFFEHKDSDLYLTKDASLSSEQSPNSHD